MSEESKPTPGTWYTKREGFSTVYVEASIGNGWAQEIAACGPTEAGQEQQEANARLIAEAGTVYHEYGLSPRELVEQRKQLQEALKQLYDAVDSCVDLTPEVLQQACAALANTERKT